MWMSEVGIRPDGPNGIGPKTPHLTIFEQTKVNNAKVNEYNSN